jgi:plastocyanin
MVPGLRPHVAIIFTVLLLVALGLAAGCGGGEEATPTETPAATPTVAADQTEFEMAMEDNSFVPDKLTVKAGETITVKLENQGNNVHNMHIAGPDNVYDVGDDDFISEPDALRAGEKGEIAFQIDQPGVYDFRCDFHASIMTGEITVQ